MYLIDTSVWIDFLRGVASPKGALLETLLEEGEAHLCEITFAEIYFGAKDRKQFDKYSKYFSQLPFFSLPTQWHREAARMGHDLRTHGYKPFMGDLLISLTALTHRATLLTTDRDFEPYQELFGLVLQ